MRSPRLPTPRTLLGLLVIAVLAATALVLFGRSTATATLEESITRAADAPFATSCSAVADIRCEVYDRSGSGTNLYLVTESGNCWSAVLVRGGGEAHEARLEGCRR